MDLIHDHKLIVADFELLRVKARVPETSGPPNETILSNRLTQSLHEHFSKEERFLFPLISRYLGSPVCDELRRECTEIMKIARATGEQRSPLQESFARLEMLLQAHIAREENVLFWYLDVRGLTEEAQNAVDFD
jgi:iron-sulfur cluster repair protein YtfE (RIC family)